MLAVEQNLFIPYIQTDFQVIGMHQKYLLHLQGGEQLFMEY